VPVRMTVEPAGTAGSLAPPLGDCADMVIVANRQK